MNECINREALMEQIADEYDLNYGETLINPKEFYEMVEDAPAVDAVEIVYCKNCKHRDKKGVCEKFRQRYPFYPEDNFYCGFGERNET